MPLADPERAASLLVCPRCRSPLEAAGAARRCTSAACALAAPGAFPTAGAWPVLVDFERSILARDEVLAAPGAALARAAGARLPRRLRAWWKPRNAVAARNLDALLGRLDPQAVVLVVGGGELGNGAEALYAAPHTVIGFDVYGSPLTQFIADAHQIPLADGSVDAVVVQAVLEHVLDPGRVVAEIHRVLRPAGLVYAETPFLQHVHAGAYDFTRFTASGHRWLFRAFEEIDAGPVAGPGTQLLWSVDHAARGLVRSATAGRLARLAFAWLRLLDRVVPPPFALDGASACFFLGRRADRELTPREIVAYYRGAQRKGA